MTEREIAVTYEEYYAAEDRAAEGRMSTRSAMGVWLVLGALGWAAFIGVILSLFA
ncbi:MAG: hypothetical protein QF491_09635 [Alphaproteobacteria bacterium]|jgi:hypothetical protein|nr:hypothetical protein [Alphaproteobacteria bacterium]|tara:strand:+ start:275 stop:439 length:165 start_codon:yes stop_codon:yes gene_type:complete